LTFGNGCLLFIIAFGLNNAVNNIPRIPMLEPHPKEAFNSSS
jgi:hypothetical protein